MFEVGGVPVYGGALCVAQHDDQPRACVFHDLRDLCCYPGSRDVALRPANSQGALQPSGLLGTFAQSYHPAFEPPQQPGYFIGFVTSSTSDLHAPILQGVPSWVLK